MSGIDRLHPALVYHIVNTLEWRSLRPLQELAVDPVLDGKDALMLAPTAGGKTESAVFPLFSKMLAEHWDGLSVIYLCPIKALLNNLEHRLRGYAELLGRRAALWHGDVGESERRKVRNHPPDLLLTTPESLEVMLVSRRVEHASFFANVRAVVVDEIHAFAGDDRGWHLLSLLARIQRLSRFTPQRLGLSATVGNPRGLLDWLSPGGNGVVLDPAEAAGAESEVRLDHVGSLANAALVISKLHRGEKRLVFCDSRAQVEQLAVALRAHGVDTHVSHSSLGREERKQAETAFAEGRNNVIAATSTLELGIDVGDLDRVIQIDAPHSVASFLQRIGRTGRRPGALRNCLFLTTREDAFLRAAGLLYLWSEGFVEPVVPPPLPYHLLAQQLLALALQEHGVSAVDWFRWIDSVPAFSGMSEEARAELTAFMLQEEMLFEDGGRWSVGQGGEAAFGFKNFMEIFSIFTSPPVFTVCHGRREIGSVHESSFLKSDEKEPTILALAGRTWVVTALDWGRRVALVAPTDQPGRSRWTGAGRPMHPALADAIAKVLAGEPLSAGLLTRRGETMLEQARRSFEGVAPGKLIKGIDESVTWWTFAGGAFNVAVAARLGDRGLDAVGDDFAVKFKKPHDLSLLEATLSELLADDDPLYPPIDERAMRDLKFTACIPPGLLAELWVARHDRSSLRSNLKQ